MAAVVTAEDRTKRDRVLWPYLPALVILGLVLYAVPNSFVEMYRIHSGLVAEFEEVPGFETLDSEVNWYPEPAGGSVTYRPLGDSGPDELKAHARALGFDDGSVANGNWIGRSRTDVYDIDTLSVAQNNDGTLAANLSVFDTDILFTWPFVLMVGLAISAFAWLIGRAVESAVLDRSSAAS